MKRPFLALLAAVTLSFGVVGTAPARAATPGSTTAAVPTPAHHHDRDHDGDHYDGGHRHHPRDYDGDHDGDQDGRRRRQCAGLVVICLL